MTPALKCARLELTLEATIVKTVRNHASTIFDKLMVATRAEAIVRARKAGLGESRWQGAIPDETGLRPHDGGS